MTILKNKNTVYGFYLIVAIIGWVTSTYAKHIVGKISPKALVLFDLTASFIFIITLVLFTNSNDDMSVIVELRKLNNIEWLGLAGLGLFGTSVRVFASALLQHHAVETMRLSGFMISMAVSGIAVYLLGQKDFTIYKAIGLLLMSIGGYLFMP
tara:strand:+ start:4682 stop:5140 length:459 start_codon:yes stop_codon:yes gene_type:complete